MSYEGAMLTFLQVIFGRPRISDENLHRFEGNIAARMSAGQPGTTKTEWNLPSDRAAREAIGKFIQQVADSPTPNPEASTDILCGVCELPLRPAAPTFSNPSVGRKYPGVVCNTCSDKAVNASGEPPYHDPRDGGDNPVFIDGKQCWRRYKFGGFITMRDFWDSPTVEEFYEHISGKGIF